MNYLCEIKIWNKFKNKLRTGLQLVAVRSRRGSRLVADQSPTDHRRFNDSYAPIPAKLVGDRSATSRRLIGDWSATSPGPVCDQISRSQVFVQFSPIAEVATRSLIGPGEVAEKSATSRGPCCDQISRSQVFEHAHKPGCDWFGRRQVPAKSPTSPRSVADQSPTNFVRIGAWLSSKLVGDWSAIGRRLVGD